MNKPSILICTFDFTFLNDTGLPIEKRTKNTSKLLQQQTNERYQYVDSSMASICHNLLVLLCPTWLTPTALHYTHSPRLTGLPILVIRSIELVNGSSKWYQSTLIIYHFLHSFQWIQLQLPIPLHFRKLGSAVASKCLQLTKFTIHHQIGTIFIKHCWNVIRIKTACSVCHHGAALAYSSISN